MPYLARIWLNPLRSAAQRLLSNPHAVHAAVLGGISRQPVQERTLWRLETDSPHRAALLVLTQSRPSFEHVVEQAGWPSADEPQIHVRDYQPLLDRVVGGREFVFRLRASTVSSTRTPAAVTARQRDRLSTPRPRGVLIPARTAAHQLAWFERHLPSWGWELVQANGLPALRLVGREQVKFRKGQAQERHQVVLQCATAEGVIRVADSTLAQQALLNGCGRARAYGCGLLTLAPLPAPMPVAPVAAQEQ